MENGELEAHFREYCRKIEQEELRQGAAERMKERKEQGDMVCVDVEIGEDDMPIEKDEEGASPSVPKKKYTKEQEVQRDIINVIASFGGFVYKNQQTAYSRVGIPDITACIPVTIKGRQFGIFFTVECKLDEKKYDATKAQKIVGEEIKKANGWWVKTSDPEEVENAILRLLSLCAHVSEE